MKWLPSFTAGMAANLWATTFFLIWVDSAFALSIRFQSYYFLALLGLGLLLIYLFFFILHYLDSRPSTVPKGEGVPFRDKFVLIWTGGWMIFYFLISIRLILNSFNYSEFQWPLSMGFCALCFLNYLLFLFLRKSTENDVRKLSFAGRLFFSLWFFGLLLAVIGQKCFR